jgi:hypothetical protein
MSISAINAASAAQVVTSAPPKQQGKAQAPVQNPPDTVQLSAAAQAQLKSAGADADGDHDGK